MVEYIPIALLCTLLGAAISVATFSRNKAKDDRAEGQQDGAVYSELGYIKANTDEIKAELRDQRKINTEIYSRLSAVESSAKQLHKRVDRIEGREYPAHTE